jgi:hypothetical protein
MLSRQSVEAAASSFENKQSKVSYGKRWFLILRISRRLIWIAYGYGYGKKSYKTSQFAQCAEMCSFSDQENCLKMTTIQNMAHNISM